MIILYLLLDGTHLDVIGIITKGLIALCVGVVIWLIKVRHEDKKETARKINQSKLDYAILNDEEIFKDAIDYNNILHELKPDVVMLIETEPVETIESTKEICNELGIKLEIVPRFVPKNLEIITTTDIVNRIKDETM